MPPLPWLERLHRRLLRWRHADRQPGPWVIAVSGGSDSVGLLRGLNALSPRLGLNLVVAHLDHGARPDSAQDAGFVADLASTLDLPIELGHWQPTRVGHFEVDARRARYLWLTEVARTHQASAVVVAHTREDQAETIMHRIIRGTGPTGLTGMAGRRVLTDEISLIRPLLDVTRYEIQTYLIAISQSWREDPTNLDQSHTRARLRHDLLPKLAAEYNPNVIAALVRLGKLMNAERRGFDAVAAEVETRAVLQLSEQAIELDLAVLSPLSPVFRVEILRRVWRRAGWPEAAMDARRWRRLASLVEGKRSRISVGIGVEASVGAGRFRLRRGVVPNGESLPAIELPIPGQVDWPSGQIRVAMVEDVGCTERIDFATVIPPLQVTSPQHGDRFDPLGMQGQTTPLADFLRGRGLGEIDRRNVPIVRDQRGIIWVVGHRIAEHVRLTDATTIRLGLSWTPSCG